MTINLLKTSFSLEGQRRTLGPRLTQITLHCFYRRLVLGHPDRPTDHVDAAALELIAMGPQVRAARSRAEHEDLEPSLGHHTVFQERAQAGIDLQRDADTGRGVEGGVKNLTRESGIGRTEINP